MSKISETIKIMSNQRHIICKICGNIKIPSNERIKVTKVCYNCVMKIVPDHIPREQHIKYLQGIKL